MFPHLTSELAMQRRGALTATADRHRFLGRTARRAADAGDVVALPPTSLAPLMRLPVPSDGRLGGASSPATQNAA